MSKAPSPTLGAGRDDAYRVRLALHGDRKHIVRLTLAAYDEFAGRMGRSGWLSFQEAVRRLPELEECLEILLADEQGRIVGSVAYSCPQQVGGASFPAGWAAIRFLAVHPDHRRMGVGAALAKACLDRARADSATHLGLSIGDPMGTARRLFERLGFVRGPEVAPQHGLRHWRYSLALPQPDTPHPTTGKPT